MRRLLATLSAVTALAGARAQTTYTWVASASGAWETATNWTPGGPPTSSISALVSTSATTTMTLGATTSGTTTNDGADNFSLEPVTGAFVLVGANVAGTNTTATDNLTVYGNMIKSGPTTTIRNSKTASNGVGIVNLAILGTFTGGSISFGSTSIALGSLTVGGLFTDNTVLAVNFNTTSANLNGGLTITGAGTINVFASSGSGGISTAFLTGNSGSVDAYTTADATATLTLDGGSGSNSFGGALVDDTTTTSEGSTLSLVKTGAGAQALTGINTFSGGTTVGGGTLYVDNPSGSGLGTGTVTVNSGGILGGTGFIAPAAGQNIVVNGGALSPGDPVNSPGGGGLTLAPSGGSGFSMAGGSALDLTLGGTPSPLNFATAGNWLSGAGSWTLNLTGGAGFQVQTAYAVLTNVNTPSVAPSSVTFNGMSVPSAAYAFGPDGTGLNYTITLIGPVITAQPASPPAGSTASFTVAATGTGTLSYQWYFDGTALVNGTQADGSMVTGAAAATLSLANVQATDHGAYQCAVTDEIGTVMSAAAAFAGPGITAQPANVNGGAGSSASFTVTAVGVGTVSYQWYFNGAALVNGTQADGSVVAGATTATLSLTNIQTSDAGLYTSTVTDSVGTTTSVPAALVSASNPTSVAAQGMIMVYEGPPPASDAAAALSYPGNPANWCNTEQIDQMAATTWTQGTGLLESIWANRYNYTALSDDRPSLIAPPGISMASAWAAGVPYAAGAAVVVTGTDAGYWICETAHTSVGPGFTNDNPSADWFPLVTGTVRRTTPLPWIPGASPAYIPNELVLYTDGNWYLCINSTSSTTPPPSDPTDWTLLEPSSTIVPQECRFEYTSFAKAVASNIVQALFVCGAPPNTMTGTGYMDVAAATGLTVYPYAYMLANTNAIFNKRPQDPSSEGGTGYATNTVDSVYLPQYRLTDCWTDYAVAYATGGSWNVGQLVQDQQNLLPDNFSGYTASDYTDAVTNQTGVAPNPTGNPIAGGSATLSGVGAAINHLYLLPATAGTIYQFTVTGTTTAASSTVPGTVVLQVIGLSADGTTEVGTPATATFAVTAPNLPFSFTQSFSSSAATGVLAWPNRAAMLRFGVVASPGLAGSPVMQISSMLVQNAADTTPTYWRCRVNTTASAPANGTAPASFTTFPTFAAIHANAANWRQQQLGIEMDYEVGDKRPSDSTWNYNHTAQTPNTNENLLYLLQNVQAACQSGGYKFILYTDDLDPNNPTSSNNAFNSYDINSVLADTDYLVPIIAGADINSDSLVNDLTVNYAVVSGQPNFTAGKMGFALDLIDKYTYPSDSVPITGVTIGPAPSYTVTVTAPGFATGGKGHYVNLNALGGALGTDLNNQLFVIASVGSGGTFTLANVTGNPAHAYAGGGIVGTGGSLVSDFAYCRQLFLQGIATYFELWRDGCDQRGYPTPSPATYTAQIVGTSVSGSTVTVTLAAGSNSSGFDSNQVYISGITSGMTELNGSVFTVTPIDATDFSLNGFNGAGLPSGPTNGGLATEALARDVTAKTAALVGDTLGPVITAQPAAASVPSGQTATLTVAAFGTGTLSYQWYFTNSNGTVALTDGGGISGSATATLSIADLQTAETGQYYAVVTDGTGPTTSSTATVMFPSLSPSLLSAVSSRTHGTAGVFSLPVSWTANSTLPSTPYPVESRSGGILSLVLTFDRTISSVQASLGSGTATVGAPVCSGTQVTVPLTAVANAQTLVIDLANVTGADNSVLPAATVALRVLAGDVNGDGVVNISDINLVRAASGSAVNSSNFQMDINADGAVDISDINLVRAASGTSVP